MEEPSLAVATKIEIAKAEAHKSGNESSWRGYNAARGQFVSAPSGEFYYGAEGSNTRSVKALPASF
jgi:hypothetical protein